MARDLLNLVSKTLTRAETNKALRTINEGLNAHESENITARTVSDSGKTVSDNPSTVQKGEHFSLVGRTNEGKAIYESNFPIGTPKSAKSERILKFIKNVWSKKPISLVISNGETSRTILAQFDPTIDESQNTPTDASKIAGGNRHGNHTEQRVTLDLADDYYQIASESTYNYSKEETGKKTSTHSDVKLWHYFVNDIYFKDLGQNNLTTYTVTINVKEKADGNFVYSFNAEKTKESSTRQTLHAAVNTRKGANGELFIDSIPQTTEKSNSFSEKTSENSSDNTKKTKYQLEAEEFDKLANEKVEGYKKLSEPKANRNSMIFV